MKATGTKGNWEWYAGWVGLKWFCVLPSLSVCYTTYFYWSVHFSFLGFSSYIEYYDMEKD